MIQPSQGVPKLRIWIHHCCIIGCFAKKWTNGLSGHVCKHVLRLNVRALLLCHAASEVPIHFCVKLQAFEDRTNERWLKLNVYRGVPMTWKMTSAYMQGMYCKWFRIISWIITPLCLLDWLFEILKCWWIVDGLFKIKWMVDYCSWSYRWLMQQPTLTHNLPIVAGNFWHFLLAGYYSFWAPTERSGGSSRNKGSYHCDVSCKSFHLLHKGVRSENIPNAQWLGHVDML